MSRSVWNGKRRRLASLLRVSAFTLAATFLMPAYSTFAAGIEETNRPINLLQMKPVKPVQLQHHAPTLEELVVRVPMPAQYNQPIPLRGVNIAGLYPKAVEQLGMTYFVVVDNTKFLRMSEVYRDCRLKGKSNFVTTDSITHPYLAFSNRIFADTVVSYVIPDTKSLVDGMMRVSINDYKSADDAEVRKDIERNIAYLAVASRLLDPKYEMPRIGNVPELAEQELKSIVSGKTAQSVVFEGTQDYSVFVPMGWYNSSPALANFYRCREWLSLVPFAVNDTGGGDQHSNMFRRSVLLFRALNTANIMGKPAIETWARLVQAYSVLGSPVESYGQRTLYPQDYEVVFHDKSQDLRVTLQALAEPFFRTKLMLAIRNQKPMNLGSSSIFEIGGSEAPDSTAVFRLFPMFGEPEIPWLRGVARLYPTDKTEAASWPLSLLDMYAWGSPQAGNILADNLSFLDPNIAKILPGLQHCVSKRMPSGQIAPVESRSWKVLSNFFRPNMEGVPGALRSELWYSQRLASAMAAWVDAASAIAPADEPGPATAPATLSNSRTLPAGQSPHPRSVAAGESPHPRSVAAGESPPSPTQPEANTSESMGRVNPAADAAAHPRRVSKVPPFHYLEPNIDYYKNLELDAQALQRELEAIHYFPPKYKGRLGDFIRLFQRLQKIADAELRGNPISVVDRRLLADIDLILDKVDVPLPAVLTFDGGKIDPTAAANSPSRGFNLAVGRPGIVYMIYQNPHSMEWSLGRGAVYTYYEMPAPLLTVDMWKHKLEAGFSTPPSWTSRFEIVQEPPTKPTQ